MGEELINLLSRGVKKMLHVQRTDRKCREGWHFSFFALSVVVAYQGVISSLGIIYFLIRNLIVISTFIILTKSSDIPIC